MMFGSNPDSLINGAFGESGRPESVYSSYSSSNYVNSPAPPMPNVFSDNYQASLSETSSSISGHSSSIRSRISDDNPPRTREMRSAFLAADLQRQSPLNRGIMHSDSSSSVDSNSIRNQQTSHLSSVDAGSSRLSHFEGGNRSSYYPTEVDPSNYTFEAISALNDNSSRLLDTPNSLQPPTSGNSRLRSSSDLANNDVSQSRIMSMMLNSSR